MHVLARMTSHCLPVSAITSPSPSAWPIDIWGSTIFNKKSFLCFYSFFLHHISFPLVLTDIKGSITNTGCNFSIQYWLRVLGLKVLIPAVFVINICIYQIEGGAVNWNYTHSLWQMCTVWLLNTQHAHLSPSASGQKVTQALRSNMQKKNVKF